MIKVTYYVLFISSELNCTIQAILCKNKMFWKGSSWCFEHYLLT